MAKREKFFQLRLSDEDRAMLRELARLDGRSSSDEVRRLISLAHKELKARSLDGTTSAVKP